MRLKINNLSKKYGSHIALSSVSFEIVNCKTLALLGPSGGGKSTLLRLLGGLDTPDSGTIAIDDNTIQYEEPLVRLHRMKIGTVFQGFNLFPHLTALENIVLPLQQVHGHSKEEAEGIAVDYLKRFELLEHAGKKPGQLSGGQKQRVAIVRAVAIRAQLFILDEPTSALDPLMTAEVLDLIAELSKEGAKIILASHHLTFVKKVADWVAFLDQGKLIELQMTKDFFSIPKSREASQFLEKVLKY